MSESDSYDSEDSVNHQKFKNNAFLDEELEKEKSKLKFKNMAAYRALKEGETQIYVDIENDLLDLPFKKGLACNNERIEISERGLIEDIEQIKKERRDRTYDGRRSDDSELLDSVRSSEDYWNDYGDELGLGTTIIRAKRSIERKRKKKEGMKPKGLKPNNKESATAKLNAKD